MKQGIIESVTLSGNSLQLLVAGTGIDEGKYRSFEIYSNQISRSIAPGDTVWWHKMKAYWTPERNCEGEGLQFLHWDIPVTLKSLPKDPFIK